MSYKSKKPLYCVTNKRDTKECKQKVKKKSFIVKNAQTQVRKAISPCKWFPTVATVEINNTELIISVKDYMVLF